MVSLTNKRRTLNKRRGSGRSLQLSGHTVSPLHALYTLLAGFSVVLWMQWQFGRSAITSTSALLQLLDTTTNSSNTSSSSSVLLSDITKSTNSKNDNYLQPPTATIAYAISLIKCGDKQSSSAGLVDAALVMRHSIHLQSYRTFPSSGSRYDYNMYAIVHRQAVECSHVLRDAGFTIVVYDPPIQPSEIKGAYLAQHIHKEWCCGHDEFVKLHAYELPGTPLDDGTVAIPEPIVVFADIDFAFYKPMDDLYDAMLYPVDSDKGREARSRILLERPGEALPAKIDAYITRDYPQLLPGRTPGYQAGFLVARRDTTVFPQVLDVIREGNYTEGYSPNNGWGGLGYGGYVGAMAMQGLMAYYYDHVRPETVVELNSCRYNHMGMDNLYRAYPNFMPAKKKEHVGKCRSTRPDCEDCTITEIDKIFNVHYTQCKFFRRFVILNSITCLSQWNLMLPTCQMPLCLLGRKPWNCISIGDLKPKNGNAIDLNCGKLG